jgi:hypothetical protein
MNREVCIKVDGVDAEALEEAIEPMVVKIIDIREPRSA